MRRFIILSICIIPNWLWAQEPERPQIDIQTFVEELFQIPDANFNYDDLYESLYQLYLTPINLNQTNQTELLELFQLDLLQVNALLEYLKNHGPMTSIYELQVIEGFDRQTIQSILPFVEVRAKGDYASKGHLLQRIANEENNFLLLRTERVLQDKRGYQRSDSGRYLGSPYKIYGRFQSRHSKDFSVGLTFEKDQGETLEWKSAQKKYGFDYYSFHLLLENKGKFKKVIAGDYQMQFGQGLILGSGFSPGKGSETITTVKRNNSGIRQYTSVLESGFMRGAAFTYTLAKNIEVTPFYSRIRQDGGIQTSTDTLDTQSYEEYVSSILETGFHRTYSELENRNQIIEQTYGVNVTYNNKLSNNFQVGMTYLRNDYSVAIQRTPNNYNQFEFKGDNNFNLGVFANYNLENLLLFAEAATSKSGGTAYVAGFVSSLSPILSLSFLYRDYSEDFHSFYGNAFSEGSRNINEKGMYWGIKIAPTRRWNFNAYYDRFSFPWLKFGAESPSTGYEYLCRLEHRPTRKINLYVQYREQSKQLTVSQENQNIKSLESGINRLAIANISYSMNPNIELKSRVQYSTYSLQGTQTSGVAIVQDLNLSISKFKLSTRFAIFDTEDFQNRQYIYEKDLLYVFSIPAYSGVGTRSYAMLQYKPIRKLTIWVKYGIYNYQNIDTIGSGNETISGNKRSELKMQIRYKF